MLLRSRPWQFAQIQIHDRDGKIPNIEMHQFTAKNGCAIWSGWLLPVDWIIAGSMTTSAGPSVKVSASSEGIA